MLGDKSVSVTSLNVLTEALKSVDFTWSDEAASCAVVRSSHVTMFTFYLYSTSPRFLFTVVAD